MFITLAGYAYAARGHKERENTRHSKEVTNMNKNKKVVCPDCQAEVMAEDDVQVGEVITCPECSANLEVTSSNPLTVTQAAAVKEDWGE